MDLTGYTLASRNIVMYPDLNAAGRLFGGQLMSWLDEASAMAAMQIMGTRRVVTKKFGEIVFDAPGKLGDVVEIWCKRARVGRTSLTLSCTVVVQCGGSDDVQQIGHSDVVYVALDEDDKPTPWNRSDEEG
jgi:acyl-CoA hydrolase